MESLATTFEDSVEKSLALCLAEAGRGENLHTGGKTGPSFFDGVSVLLALSGGIDSSALLLALKSIGQNSKSFATNSLGLEIFACHVNHHLRGAESARDEQHCRELCRNLSVPLTVVDLESDPERHSEAQLRTERYQRLLRVGKQLTAPYIVTAHNLDDQIETLLFRLVRGTSLRGLVGINRVRPLEANSKWPILLRPLLDIKRSDIEAYLAEKGQIACLDLSNTGTKYSRNFLRNKILPPLKERFPSLVANVEHFRRTLQSENDYMTEQSAALYNRAFSRPNRLLLSVLEGEHRALIGRALAFYIEQAGLEPSFERVERMQNLLNEALLSSERDFVARCSFGENLELLVTKDSILLKPLYELTHFSEEYEGRLAAMAPVAVKMPRQGRSQSLTMIPWLNYAFSIEEGSNETLERVGKLERSSMTVLVDLGNARTALILRPRRPGDFLQPVGMTQKVRLKQYLHANKSLFAGARRLLPSLNDSLAQRLTPVLALGESQEVLWVPGFGISDKIKPGKSSTDLHLLSLLPLSADPSSPADNIC